MSSLLKWCACVALLASLSTVLSGQAIRLRLGTTSAVGEGGEGELLTSFDDEFTYQGCFRGGSLGATNFGDGGLAIAYNPNGNGGAGTIYMADNSIGYMAEMRIPTPVITTVGTSCPAATLDYSWFSDATEGNSSSFVGYDDNTRGLLVYNNRLIITFGVGYDSDNNQYQLASSRPTNLAATGDWKGWVYPQWAHPVTDQVSPKARMFSGAMVHVPAAWQAALGGPALMTNCCPSVVTNTSYGPSAASFNPDDITGAVQITINPILYYPTAHPELGCYTKQHPDHLGDPTYAAVGCQNDNYGMGSHVNGMAIFGGTLLFFGRQGTPETEPVYGTTRELACYGLGGNYTGTDPTSSNAFLRYAPGTTIVAGDLDQGSDSDKNGVGDDVGGHRCRDPQDSAKGKHAWPYRKWIWAYRLSDLAEVKAGTRQPWDVDPYDTWELTTLPLVSALNIDAPITGVAYDSVGRRLFILQRNAVQSVSTSPAIHVYHKNNP